MATTVQPGVEVYIWVAKDKGGNYVNAFTAGVDGGGRVGHAALKIIPTAAQATTYSALLKGKDHVYVSLWPGRFNPTYQDDFNGEGGEAANTVIRLNNLDTTKMLDAFSQAVDAPCWILKATTTSPLGQYAQSCASFVYKLLEIGGIFDKTKYTSANYAGPGWDFYYATNCHLGDICYGVFNRFGWRGWAVSPKLVQHVAASAAESNAADKAQTLALMKNVQSPPAVSGSQVAAGVTAASAAAAGTAAIVAIAALKK
jgi:hypothetical protein